MTSILEPALYWEVGSLPTLGGVEQWSPVGVVDSGGPKVVGVGNPGVISVSLRATSATGDMCPLAAVGSAVWVKGSAAVAVGAWVAASTPYHVATVTGTGDKYPAGYMLTAIDNADELGIMFLYPHKVQL